MMNLSTRRRLLKTGLASALFAASGVPVAARPRRGGCLRLAIDAKSAPPFGLPAGFGHEFCHLATYAGVFETLVEIAPDGMLRGELAETWRGSPDARIWSFRLRDGVRFHDGTPLVAENVVRALQGQHQSWALRNAASIEVTDRLEVQVTLSAPDSSFPFLLSSPEFAVLGGGIETLPLGTGPYRVSRYRPGERLDATRFEQAHHQGEGHFERVEVLGSGALSHRIHLLNSGRVDALAETAPRLVSRMLSSPDVQAGWIRDARFLIFDVSQIARKDLRQKFESAINAETMVRDILHGRGKPVFPGGTTGTRSDGPQVEIGIVRGPGFDETAARLVASLARTSGRAGVSLCSGCGAHGTITVRWAESAEALDFGVPNAIVVLSADTLDLVSDRVLGPGRTGARFPLDDARIARRWWLS